MGGLSNVSSLQECIWYGRLILMILWKLHPMILKYLTIVPFTSIDVVPFALIPVDDLFTFQAQGATCCLR
jgi:hypothetical protein